MATSSYRSKSQLVFTDTCTITGTTSSSLFPDSENINLAVKTDDQVKTNILSVWSTIIGSYPSNGIVWNNFVFCSTGYNSSFDINNSYAVVYDGTLWTTRLVSSKGMSKLAWSPSLRIFVTLSDTSPAKSFVSLDGYNWSTYTQTKLFKGVCWSESLGIFSAVSLDGIVGISSNGINWSTYTKAGQWAGVTWSPELGIFCSVGLVSSYAMYSKDGINWTNSLGLNAAASNIIWSGSLFVTGTSDTNVSKSLNGINWSTYTVSTGGQHGIVYIPELSLYILEKTSAISVSYNLVDWSSYNTGVTYNSIAWSPQLKRLMLGKQLTPSFLISNTNFFGFNTSEKIGTQMLTSLPMYNNSINLSKATTVQFGTAGTTSSNKIYGNLIPKMKYLIACSPARYSTTVSIVYSNIVSTTFLNEITIDNTNETLITINTPGIYSICANFINATVPCTIWICRNTASASTDYTVFTDLTRLSVSSIQGTKTEALVKYIGPLTGADKIRIGTMTGTVSGGATTPLYISLLQSI